MDTTKLESIIREHEGYRQFAYQDSLGYVTISIGRCIDSRKGKGISLDEALYLLRNDIAEYRKELEKFSWYQKQNEVRKCALIELSFKSAASHFLDSKWASQVKSARANDIAYRIECGEYRD
jgi:lysozyme